MKITAAFALYLCILFRLKKEFQISSRKTAWLAVMGDPVLLLLHAWYAETQFWQIIFVFLYLFSLAVTDACTLHIGRCWVIFSAAFFLLCLQFPAARFQLAGALSFSLPAFLLSRKYGWMGSADPLFLLMFGWLLGLERMLVAMVFALLAAFASLVIIKQKKLPFLSFLSFGFMIAFLRGYSLYAFFFL